MAKITFKTKIKQVYNPDDTPAHEIVVVPIFARSHCDMNAFRQHPKYQGIANSDLFPNALARIRRDLLGGYKDWIRVDQLPANVTVNRSSFLATVSVEV